MQSNGFRMPKQRLYKNNTYSDLIYLLDVNGIDTKDLDKNTKKYDLLAKMKEVLSAEDRKIKIPGDQARRFIKYLIMLAIITVKGDVKHAGE